LTHCTYHSRHVTNKDVSPTHFRTCSASFSLAASPSGSYEQHIHGSTVQDSNNESDRTPCVRTNITLYHASCKCCDIANGFTGVCDVAQVDVLAGLLVVGHKQGEARVYQFSQEQQEVSCVDLDGKRPAEHHSRQQPPGFQCILQCTHHAASISSIAIAARLKLVALADETGVLSLLELTRVC